MRKGFTLIEVIAVITVLFLLTIGVVPAIIKQMNEKKEEISDVTLALIKQASDLYVTNDPDKYKKEINNVYCITLNDLVKGETLDKKIVNFKTGKQIPLSRAIKVTVNSYYEFEYELLGEGVVCG